MDSFDFDALPSAREPKSGRRRHREATSADIDLALDKNSSRLLSASSSSPPMPRRTGGWADTSKGEAQLEDARLRRDSTTNNFNEDEIEDNIPDIPSLEDAIIDSNQVASAPQRSVKLATMHDLEVDLGSSLFMLDNELDLRLLSQCLSSESDVKEDDRKWQWDIIFTEVMSELRADKSSSLSGLSET